VKNDEERAGGPGQQNFATVPAATGSFPALGQLSVVVLLQRWRQASQPAPVAGGLRF